MSNLEDRLRSLTPQDPSGDYFGRGIERIRTAALHDRHVTSRWRFAAVALGAMLALSVALNLLLWQRERNPTASIDLMSTTLPGGRWRAEAGDSVVVTETWLVLRDDVYVGGQLLATLEATAEQDQ